MLAGYNWEKVKSLCGQAWPQRRGTKLQRFFVALLPAFCSFACIITCTTSPDKALLSEPSSQSSSRSATSAPGPSHPRQATAWDTQVLLMTHPQPPIEELQTCQTELLAAAKEANQDADMLQAQEQFTGHVKSYPQLYHWCFYQAVFALDTTINQPGITLADRSTMFFDAMKQLWILARALDRVYKGDPYFLYLQNRYLELSQTLFGRQLSIIGLPLGGKPPPLQNPPKPAGEISEEEDIDE